MRYFPLRYFLEGEERYLIWISNDKDLVATSGAGVIPSFADHASMQSYADLKGYALEAEEPVLQDLDALAVWCKSPEVPVDCVAALCAWNLFSDVAASLPDVDHQFKQLDKTRPATYQKLFWGNNLPAVTPPGEHYIPDWNSKEVTFLQAVLASGLNMFRSHVREWSAT